MIKEIIGFKGKIVNDLTKPDGTPRKLMDSSRLIKLGWKPSISLFEGISTVYENLKVYDPFKESCFEDSNANAVAIRVPAGFYDTALNEANDV